MHFKICILLILAAYASAENKRLKEVFSWKIMDYAFENASERDDFIKNGTYKPNNNLPLGLDVWRDKLFITVPRWKDGVASTLNYVKISNSGFGGEFDPDVDDEDPNEDIAGSVQYPDIIGIYPDDSDRNEEDGPLDAVGDLVTGENGALGAVTGLLGTDDDEDGPLDAVGDLVTGENGALGAVTGLLGTDDDEDGPLDAVGDLVTGENGALGAVTGLLGTDDDEDGPLDAVGDLVTGENGALGAVSGLLGTDDDEDGPLDAVGDLVTGENGALGAVTGLLGTDDDEDGPLDAVGDLVTGENGALGAVTGLLGTDDDEDGPLDAVGDLVTGENGALGAVTGLLGTDDDEDGPLDAVGDLVTGENGALGAVTGLLGTGDDEDGPLDAVGDLVTGENGALGAVTGLLGTDDDEDGPLDAVGDLVTGENGALGAVTGLLGTDDDEDGPLDAVGDLVTGENGALGAVTGLLGTGDDEDGPLDAVGDLVTGEDGAISAVTGATDALPGPVADLAAAPVLDAVGGATDALPGPVAAVVDGVTDTADNPNNGGQEDEDDEDEEDDSEEGDDEDDDENDDDEDSEDVKRNTGSKVGKKRNTGNRKKRNLSSENVDSLLRKSDSRISKNITSGISSKKKSKRGQSPAEVSEYKLRGEKNGTEIRETASKTRKRQKNDQKIPGQNSLKKGEANERDGSRKKGASKMKNTPASKKKPKNVDFENECRDALGNPCGRPESLPIYAEINLEPPKKNKQKNKKNKNKKNKNKKACAKECAKKEDCKNKKKKKKNCKGDCGKPSKVTSTSPLLIPYPSFEANTPSKIPTDKRLTSVFRVRVDACDRLWVMDTGVADILGKYEVYSPPQILIYNLLNDKLVRSYTFTSADMQADSFFANIIVDVTTDKCDEAFAYIPDLGSYAIVVYNFKTEKTHRIKHNYFHFSPLEGNYNVGGVNFQWTDGVFGVALTRPHPDGSRTAYFHALSSYSQFKVNSLVLQDEEQGKKSNYTAYELVGNKGTDSQTSASFIHEPTGVMFYTQVNKDAIYCWNTDKPFNTGNLQEVASDDKTMIFPNDLKVDYNHHLWVLTDKLPVYVIRDLDSEEVNYRIFVSSVADAIKDTTCAP